MYWLDNSFKSNFDAIAKDYAAQNLKVIDEQRQKADQVRKSIELDGSGKSNNAASTLDKSIDQTLTSNLYHKSEALKNGLRYDKQSRTFKEV